MANISRDTFKLNFEKMKHYVSVRLQQGVPVVDADINEMQDVRKYELRTFIKWFIGNGIPAGDDGFHIFPVERENDFDIGPGRCLVDGWDVAHEVGDPIFEGNDPSYQNQPLFNNPELAEKWGVAQLPALAPPSSGARTDTIYLDVWEREVNSDEDAELIDPLIGIETCVRLRREWVVRVAPGVKYNELPEREELPSVNNPAVNIEHVYYPLAEVERQPGDHFIGSFDDVRETGLTVVDLKKELEALRGIRSELEETKSSLQALQGIKEEKDTTDTKALNKETKDTKDSKDGKDAKDTKDTKDSKDGKDTKDTKDGKDGKDTKDTKDGKDAKDTKDTKDSKDGKDTKDTKDSKDGKDTKDTKDGKDGKDTKDTKDGKDGKDTKDTKDGKDSKDSKDTKEFDKTPLPDRQQEQAPASFYAPKFLDIWQSPSFKGEQTQTEQAHAHAFIRPHERPEIGGRALEDDR